MKHRSRTRYYVNYRLLGRCLSLTLRERNPRLWLMVIGFVALYLVHRLLLLALRLLDELVCPGYREAAVVAPVFIIANPRSGTTYLQRLLCQEDAHYTSMRLIDTLFPAACFHKFVRAVGALDRRTGRHIERLLAALDRRFFKGWDEIHRMGFTHPEEDENLFVLTLMSPGIFLLFPFLDRVLDNQLLDSCEPEVRARVMDFYEDSLRRFIFATGRDKTYLTKNVFSSGRIRALLERFPDAKIIYIARHPYAAVPSLVSMFSSLYRAHSPRLPAHAPAYRAWARLGARLYLHCLQLEQELTEQQLYAIRYEDLIQAPAQTVLGIFQFFGWTPSPRYLRMLAHEHARQRDYQSKHHYSLEQYRLSKGQIYAELRPVFEKYRFQP